MMPVLDVDEPPSDECPTQSMTQPVAETGPHRVRGRAGPRTEIARSESEFPNGCCVYRI